MCILIIYELNNFDHALGVMSQTRVSGGNRTHDPHAYSLAHYPQDYQGTQKQKVVHIVSHSSGLKILFIENRFIAFQTIPH